MIIGNKKEQNFLKELLEKENRGTVLIFGPDGVGKFSFLKEYLHSKNDFEKIFLNTEDKNFKIDSARLLSSLSQRRTDKRIVVIDDAHKFQIEAQNTILKSLEEPSSKTIFVLVTHRFYKILPTIRSRSIFIKFGLVQKEEVFNFLKAKNYEIKDINDVLEFYPGQPGKALKLLENQHKLKLLKKFISASKEEKLFLLGELKNNFKLQEFLEFYLIFEKIKLKDDPKNFIEKIKNTLSLYFDSDYNLNFELQLANLILNYG